MKKKVIGILGGMGPEATAYFFSRIIEATAAAKDQGHVPILIWNNPRVPPRTDAIFRRGPSPLPHLLKGVEILESGGAGLIVMPCVTAHRWAQEIAARASVPFVSLIEEAVAFSLEQIPGLKRAGLIASSGTVASGLWHEAFGRKRVEILTPGVEEQEELMAAIFGKAGIKAGVTTGPPRTAVRGIACSLAGRGAEAVIAGCTEVPLVLRDADIPVPLVEPMRIAARACVRRAGYPVRET